jgi:hypothetical protein
MPITSYPRITLNTTGTTNNAQSGTGLAILNQTNGQYVIADSNLFPINNGGIASQNTLVAIQNSVANLALESTLGSVLSGITLNNTYNQTQDISAKYTLTNTATAISSAVSCSQVVLIAPLSGFYLTIQGGGEMFFPPYSTIPVNVTNLNRLLARYQTDGEILSYYYH